MGEFLSIYFGKPFMQLRVRDRAITSHDACTSGIYRILTAASLQRMNIEALIPTPADCEVRSVIKSLNAQSIVTIEIEHSGLVFGEFINHKY